MPAATLAFQFVRPPTTLVALTASLVALTGCAKPALPPCGDPEVMGLVDELVDESGVGHVRQMFKGMNNERGGLDIRLEDARTIHYDPATPIRHCQVELVTELSGAAALAARAHQQSPRQHITVAYDILLTDDGHLWVQVHPW